MSIDWGDGRPLELYGNLASCQIRYPDRKQEDIHHFNYYSKKIESIITYAKRGVYQVNASAFDMRHYAEASLQVTIFKSPCSTPRVWIPLNHTSIDKPLMIPEKPKSKLIEIQGVADMHCTQAIIN